MPDRFLGLTSAMADYDYAIPQGGIGLLRDHLPQGHVKWIGGGMNFVGQTSSSALEKTACHAK
ncbi:MAG: hypothetical protein WBN92_07570, partial [Terriglobia bacterium]